MGHGVGGHTDLSKLKIPHYTEYQVSKEHTPELWAFKERLAREGLKDPWMRNYVFMFDKRYSLPLLQKFRGAIIGSIIGAIGFAGLVYYDKNYECAWHHPHDEPYKLLYERNGNNSAHAKH